MTEPKTYRDGVKCPKGHAFVVFRRVGTAGKLVKTYCRMCEQAYQIKAGGIRAAIAGQNGGANNG